MSDAILAAFLESSLTGILLESPLTGNLLENPRRGILLKILFRMGNDGRRRPPASLFIQDMKVPIKRNFSVSENFFLGGEYFRWECSMRVGFG